MSRNQTVFFLLLVLLIFAGLGLVATQTRMLESRLNNLAVSTGGRSTDAQKMADEIANLKKELKDLQDKQDDAAKLIGDLSANLKQDLKDEIAKNYLTIPRAAPPEQAFAIGAAENGVIKVSGHAATVSSWVKSDHFFLENLLKETASAEQDPKSKTWNLTKVASDGLLTAIGLKTGDTITSVNDVPLGKLDELTKDLIALKPTKIAIKRGDQDLVLNIIYDASDPEHLALTRDEFFNLLPDLFTNTKFVPAIRDGKGVGVQIVSIEPTSAFALMGLKAEDIITAVNGEPASLKSLLDKLSAAKGMLEISYERATEKGSVKMAFAE